MKINKIAYTSFLGFPVIFALTVYKIVIKRNYGLFLNLIIQVVYLWGILFILPLGVLTILFNSIPNITGLLQNILDCILLGVMYILGVIITNIFLIWKKENIDNNSTTLGIPRTKL